MIDHGTQAAERRSARRWGTGAALVAAGLAGGVIIAGAMGASANAATTTPSPAATSGATSGATGGRGATPTTPQHPTGDQSKPQRCDETLLTGDTAAKVTAAALARYPNATVQRVETDSASVYEAHIVTTAGDWIIVQVGKDFSVTGTQQPGPGGPGGYGGPGTGAPGVDPDPNDNDGPGSSSPGGSQPGSSSTSGSTATPSSTA